MPAAGSWSRSCLDGHETWQELPFYAKHKVDEVLIVDCEKRAVD
jgi:hypothetical protein